MAEDRSAARRTREPRQEAREAGFSLVILAITVTVLGILIAAALPKWSHAIQREKEEELISRGIQYAEAIRIFQIRYQRPPNKLEELIETKPRCIRRLWKDPMSDDGKWGIVFVGQGSPLQRQPGAPQENNLGPDPNCPGCPRNPGGANPEGQTASPGGDENNPHAPPRKGDTVAVGPIAGVHSKSNKKSILIFNGRTRYDEWMFTVDLVNQAQRVDVPGGGAAVPLGPQDPSNVNVRSLRWIGRPLPAFLDPAQSGSMPNTSAGPNSTGSKPRNPRGGFHVPDPKDPRRRNDG